MEPFDVEKISNDIKIINGEKIIKKVNEKIKSKTLLINK